MTMITTQNVVHPWNVLVPPSSQNFFPTPIPPWHVKDPIIAKDVPPPCTKIHVPDVGATIETWEKLGGENWAKCVHSTKHKMNIHVA